MTHSHFAKKTLPHLFSLLLLMTLLPGCISMLEAPPRAPLASEGEDAGPRPVNPGAIIANWANAHYAFIPADPFTPEELSLSEPVPISYHDIILGHKIGWQVISGPENRRLAREMELPYTRFIICRGQIISIVSQSYPFPEVR